LRHLTWKVRQFEFQFGKMIWLLNTFLKTRLIQISKLFNWQLKRNLILKWLR
jgi:hypothetical protein